MGMGEDFGVLCREEKVCHDVYERRRMNGARTGRVIPGEHFDGHGYKGVDEK